MHNKCKLSALSSMVYWETLTSLVLGDDSIKSQLEDPHRRINLVELAIFTVELDARIQLLSYRRPIPQYEGASFS